jgi:hypothetical protein
VVKREAAARGGVTAEGGLEEAAKVVATVAVMEEEGLVVVEQEAGKAEVEKGGVERALVVVSVGKCSPAVS